MGTIRIPDHLRFWEPEADRLLMEFVRQALDEGGTVLDGCHRFVQALQASGPRVTPSPEQMAMRWEVLQAFGGYDPARDPVARRGLPGSAQVSGGPRSLAKVAEDLRRVADELQRIARRLEHLTAQGDEADPAGEAGPGGGAHATGLPPGEEAAEEGTTGADPAPGDPASSE